MAAVLTLAGGPASAQDTAPQPPAGTDTGVYEGRLIRRVVIEFHDTDGQVTDLPDADAQLIRNQLRAQEGRPYRAETVTEDSERLNRLGRFRRVESYVQLLDDGSVQLTYVVVQQPIVQDVQVVGNRRISDQKIAEVVDLLAGAPVDQFQIDRARRAIEDLYREKGYYRATVTIDEQELEETGIVLFKIQEAERVRITGVRFEGNDSFSARELRPSVKTKTVGIFDRGRLDFDQLDEDVASLIEFYRDRGYLDVRVGRIIRDSPNGREAIVIFVIEEGPVYTTRNVELVYEDGRGEYTSEQLAALIPIKRGDVYSARKLREAERIIQKAFYKLGYARPEADRGTPPVRVRFVEYRDPDAPFVDVQVRVEKGERFKTGIIQIAGNYLTRDNVVRRMLRMRPERPLDQAEIDESLQRLNQGQLFDRQQHPPKITPQHPDPSEPGYRDVLVEVQETNTGSFNIGGAVDSDAGLRATISLTQRNFDLTDTPDSFDELVSGRAFRGGGQTFQLQLLPGDRVQTYLLGLSEPHLLDTDYSGGILGQYRNRVYQAYDEEKYGGTLTAGRRFGTRWQGTARLRVESLQLQNIEPDAPVDVFDFAERNTVTGLQFSLTRNTFNNQLRPSRGTRTMLSAEQTGVLGGDFTFSKLSLDHTLYIPIHESFEGHRTILALNGRVGYIPQDRADVPTYDRFYLGGRNFRGFDFRTVSPKGIRNDTGLLGTDPIGGTWMFFASAEIQQPIVRDFVSVVGFIDSGTVTFDPGFDDYRVSVGAGLRISVPQLSPLPLAFDFGFPIVDQPGDDGRLFSFSIDVPFQ